MPPMMPGMGAPPPLSSQGGEYLDDMQSMAGMAPMGGGDRMAMLRQAGEMILKAARDAAAQGDHEFASKAAQIMDMLSSLAMASMSMSGPAEGPPLPHAMRPPGMPMQSPASASPMMPPGMMR